MTDDKLRDKFMKLAAVSSLAGRAKQLYQGLAQLATSGPVGPVFDAMTTDHDH